MRKLLLFVAILVSSKSVFANGGVEKKGSPMVTGVVTDAITKKPVADVTITAIHTISKTEHVISTDANGNFKIPQLPLGSYKFKFEKDNYKSLEKTNITVKQEATTKINVEILNYKDEEVEDRKNWLFKFDY